MDKSILVSVDDIVVIFQFSQSSRNLISEVILDNELVLQVSKG